MVRMQRSQRVPDEIVQAACMGLDLDAASVREQHDRRLPHVVDPPGEIALGFDGDPLLDEDVLRQPQGPHAVGNRGGNGDDLGLVREAHQSALAASAREQLRLDHAAARQRGDRFTRSVELPARDREAAPPEQIFSVRFIRRIGESFRRAVA